MKRTICVVLSLFVLTSGIFAAEGATIVIGVSPFPHKEIARVAKAVLEKEGLQRDVHHGSKKHHQQQQPHAGVSQLPAWRRAAGEG